MSDDLTELTGIGPDVASNLRDAGFETKRQVLEATPAELADVKHIGMMKARTIVGEKPSTAGTHSKFQESRDDIIEAARGGDSPSSAYLNIKQISHAGGISEPTLYRWLEDNDEFRKEFMEARHEAAHRLVARALNPDDETDSHFVKFLLERCFSFIKTEQHEVKLDNDAQLPDTRADFVTYGEDE